ncbi:flagellar motor switch protein FliN [Aurantimonas aggregata]|uniref:Flagellar motor switch protein FliN n=1 Tax=Aurantimonas aggregata TaxID=2047720 RepID=A0A6L9MD75_9HYPH|nr:flagellar motor switch protein FliN [Aurantimonas aggregata]NDV85755.1 flagellar motor switch protein FliN [Aurantimonas aggregata]
MSHIEADTEAAAFETKQPARPGPLDIDIVMDVPVTMQVVLGSATMTVANILKLGRGAVVKLDTKVGDPVDVVVNGRLVARGEIVILDNEDQRFGLTLTEVATPGAQLKPKQRVA